MIRPLFAIVIALSIGLVGTAILTAPEWAKLAVLGCLTACALATIIVTKGN